jgi:dipeptidyl aminopeptidase/acylaminoacyl peptidase
MTENFEVYFLNNKISGIMTIPDSGKKYPCVILSHGLISSKESSKYIVMSESLNHAGIASCRFDYHGCGESDGNIEETTLTTRVGNLNSITEYIISQGLIDSDKIGILGSSFGGSACIVKAASDKRIKCVALWATPYRLDKKDDGMISGIKFNESIYTDFETYDLLSEAKKISCALVMHGEIDETVPCSEGKTIYKCLEKPKKLEIIKGADHIFSNLSHREKAIDISLNWFRRFFAGS